MWNTNNIVLLFKSFLLSSVTTTDWDPLYWRIQGIWSTVHSIMSDLYCPIKNQRSRLIAKLLLQQCYSTCYDATVHYCLHTHKALFMTVNLYSNTEDLDPTTTRGSLLLGWWAPRPQQHGNIKKLRAWSRHQFIRSSATNHLHRFTPPLASLVKSYTEIWDRRS